MQSKITSGGLTEQSKKFFFHPICAFRTKIWCFNKFNLDVKFGNNSFIQEVSTKFDHLHSCSWYNVHLSSVCLCWISCGMHTGSKPNKEGRNRVALKHRFFFLSFFFLSDAGEQLIHEWLTTRVGLVGCEAGGTVKRHNQVRCGRSRPNQTWQPRFRETEQSGRFSPELGERERERNTFDTVKWL